LSSALQPTAKPFPSWISRERLKFWGIQSGASLLDQGLTSGTNFVLNLLLARWLAPESYGAFAVAFATLLFVFGYHSVLLLEPMSVLGPANYASKIATYFRAQLHVHFLLTAGLSFVLLLIAAVMSMLGIHRELVAATLASGMAFPLVLFLWLVRRMCYVAHRPAVAVWASASYLVLLLAGLFTMHRVGYVHPATAMLLMAGASVGAVFIPLSKLGILSNGSVSLSWKQILRENWTYGRWLVASTTLYAVASQTQTYLTAAMLGLGAAGILRAMQMPSFVMMQVVTALSLLLLPMMAREYGLGNVDQLRKKAVYSSVALVALAAGYAVCLEVFAHPIEKLMYADKFSSTVSLIPILGLVPVCMAFAAGFSMALRASQKPQFDLLANAVSAPIGLVTAILFIRLWGITGACISMVAGFVAYAGVFFWSFVRWTNEGARKAINVPNG
jgi:O-antigen/teichoic acid export membrane protein